MFVIDNIVGDAEFEYFGNELVLFFTAENSIAEITAQFSVSEYALVAMHAALTHSMAMVMANRISKDELIQGTLHQAVS